MATMTVQDRKIDDHLRTAFAALETALNQMKSITSSDIQNSRYAGVSPLFKDALGYVTAAQTKVSRCIQSGK